MITLTGSTSISTLSKTIQAPQDSIDNVEQVSVQLPFQALLNNIYSTIDKLPYLKPSLCMSSLDGTNITIKAFSGLWASKNALTLDYTTLQRAADVTLTGTSVFGGGGYVANTTYYVYAKYDPAKTESTDFVLRTNAPDVTKTWLVLAGDPQFDHRYIGSVIVFPLPGVVPFAMANREYDFVQQRGIGSYGVIVDTDVTITLLPTTAVTSKISAEFTNINVTTNGSFEIKPKGSTYISFAPVSQNTPNATGTTRFELPAIGTPFNTYQVKFTGGVAVAECIAALYWVGYRE